MLKLMKPILVLAFLGLSVSYLVMLLNVQQLVRLGMIEGFLFLGMSRKEGRWWGKMTELIKKKAYEQLIADIGVLLEEARKKVYAHINQDLVKTYWELGRRIVEYEQKGEERAEYGSELLERISQDLRQRYGKGFGRRNVLDMRRFYLTYKKWQTVSAELSWSHYIELLSIDNELDRNFYEKECQNERWSLRELKRQIDSALFHRLAVSKNKEGVLKLSKESQIIRTEEDVIRDPYVLEFLQIAPAEKYTEKEFEQRIIDNLQLFLLELGKGFTFVKRQYRISLGTKHYYVDLVFYHRILKCFVLLDLKIGEVTHQDIGQMNLYLNYFAKEENSEGDTPPIGIVLSARKNEIDVEYALGGISNKLFVSKYRLYLPDKKELEEKVRKIINISKE